MNYVFACMTLLHSSVERVTVKAPGREISRAADVVEIRRKRFMQEIKIGSTKTGTEQLTGTESRVPSNVGAMELGIAK